MTTGVVTPSQPAVAEVVSRGSRSMGFVIQTRRTTNGADGGQGTSTCHPGRGAHRRGTRRGRHHGQPPHALDDSGRGVRRGNRRRRLRRTDPLAAAPRAIGLHLDPLDDLAHDSFRTLRTALRGRVGGTVRVCTSLPTSPPTPPQWRGCSRARLRPIW